MSFADMMTLLFCLFMVLFAISSVNTSKFEELQKSLKDAFSGAVLDGGKSMLNSGSDEKKTKQSAVEPPLPSMRPLTAINNTSAKNVRRGRPRRPSRRSRTSARSSGAWTSSPRRPACTGKVNVTVRRRGLVIQLLTDKVFFSSGDAILQPEAHAWSPRSAQIVRDERSHPVVVEGYTDSQPISNSRYQSNWDLSGARAAAVVNDFAKIGVLAEPDVPAGLRQPDPDRHATPRRKAVRRTGGWRSSSPGSTPAAPTRSQPPSAWRR